MPVTIVPTESATTVDVFIMTKQKSEGEIDKVNVRLAGAPLVNVSRRRRNRNQRSGPSYLDVIALANLYLSV